MSDFQDPRDAYYAGRRDERNEIIRDLGYSGSVRWQEPAATPAAPVSMGEAWTQHQEEERRRKKAEHRESVRSALFGIALGVAFLVCLIYGLKTGFHLVAPW